MEAYDMNEAEHKYQNKIVTIPNILSVFRILLIPVIVWLYCGKHAYLYATLVLTLSGATDVVDGFIARRFGMISNVGKALDPIADKLTQMAMLSCLLTRFPLMLLPLVLLVVKELFAGVTGLLTIKKTGVVLSAVWHGKLTTVVLYAMMAIHLVWVSIPTAASNALVVLCTLCMLTSGILYAIRNLSILMGKRSPQEKENNEK